MELRSEGTTHDAQAIRSIDACLDTEPPAELMMARIFLCYRAGDDAYAAALLDVMLSNVIGRDDIFRASRSILPGESYSDAIVRAIKECDIMLVLIGPDWAIRADHAGTPLLSRPDDWVRSEIAAALQNGVRIIPILLSRALRLKETDLPADIAPLAYRQYLRFEHRNIEDDFARLLNALQATPPAA